MTHPLTAIFQVNLGYKILKITDTLTTGLYHDGHSNEDVKN